MVPYQKFHQGSVVGVEPHAARDRTHQTRADLRMAAAKSLADVVKHEAEIEQLDFIGFASELGEKRQRVFVRAGLEHFNFFDQFQGVLVDRVNVVGVMQDHAKQSAELRDEGS